MAFEKAFQYFNKTFRQLKILGLESSHEFKEFFEKLKEVKFRKKHK